MLEISLVRLNEFRSVTFNLIPGNRLASADEAVDFVNRRGFVTFWPVKGMDCPSLWVAAAGDRPVPDEHDDPGHVTWGWKDSQLGLRRWYYARCIARRNAMISLDLLPNFYALSPNYGNPAEDIREEYRLGTLRLETRQVFETLEQEGPLDTLALRKAARLSSPENDGRFSSALDDLQMAYRIVPVGISQAGAWRYAFIYDLVNRHFPSLLSQAQAISELSARQVILSTYIHNVGAAQEQALLRLFRWRREDLTRVIESLVKRGEVLTGLTRTDAAGAWIGLSELIR